MKFRFSSLAPLVVVALATVAFARYGQTGGTQQSTKSTTSEAKPAKPAMASENISTALTKHATLKTFAELVKTADLSATFEGTGPFTVFAPTDEAFKMFPKEQMDALKGDKTKLADFVKGFVIEGKSISTREFEKMNGQKMTTLAGTELAFSYAEGKAKVGSANVTGRQVRCTNGVIHELAAVSTSAMAMPAASTPAPAPSTTPAPGGGTGK